MLSVIGEPWTGVGYVRFAQPFRHLRDQGFVLRTLARRIYDALYPTRPEFETADLLALLEREPELLAINAHVRQKPLTRPIVS